MGTTNVRIEFHFFKKSVLDSRAEPYTALYDLLALLESLSPLRVQYVQLVTLEQVHLNMHCHFGAREYYKIEALKRAAIIAEGEAGFQSAFFEDDNLFLKGLDAGVIDLVNPTLPSGEAISVCLSTINALPRIADRMRLSSNNFGYAVDMEFDEGSKELAKTLIPAIQVAESVYSRIPGLADDLRATISVVNQPGWLVNEAIILDHMADQTFRDFAESELLTSCFESHPYLTSEVIDVNWSPAEALFDAVHQVNELPAHKAISRRRPLKYLRNSIADALTDASFTGTPNVLPPKELKSVSHEPIPERPFAFLSYAHKDADAAKLLAVNLSELGVNIWFDEGISVGDVWDETLESRIRDSEVLIALVSEDYNRSRYCRREIKFADLLQKLILPVSNSKHEWGEGLQFMFQELQIQNLSVPPGLGGLHHQIMKMAPTCCADLESSC